MLQLKRLDAEDLDLIVRTLKEFTDREAPLEKRLRWDETDVCPEDVVRAMLGPEVGLHLVFLPAEYDGMGGGAYDVYRLSCEFAKIDLGLATAMLAVALGTDPIRVGCTDEQKARWIPRIANEGLIVAYGVTEPEAGSNVQSLKTEAERITDADGRVTHYRLNGVKQFETRLGPTLDADFRKQQVDRCFGSVFAAVVERVMSDPGFSDRQRVLSELTLPQVLLFRDVNEDNYKRFVKRLAGKLATELRGEFPGAPIEAVSIQKTNGGASTVSVAGLAEGAPDHDRIAGRARELWDAQGTSLTQIRM